MTISTFKPLLKKLRISRNDDGSFEVSWGHNAEPHEIEILTDAAEFASARQIFEREARRQLTVDEVRRLTSGDDIGAVVYE